MNMDELEELLGDILPPGFQIVTNNKGQVVVYTNLRQEDDGELVDLDDGDDTDPDADPDFEALEDEDTDEDDS